MARAAAPIFSGFRVATSTTRRLSRLGVISHQSVALSLSPGPSFYGAMPPHPTAAAPATSALAVHLMDSARIDTAQRRPNGLSWRGTGSSGGGMVGNGIVQGTDANFGSDDLKSATPG